jgi:regulator of protease activity HflC (stomatin/prohibitin superfamily)
VSPTSPGNPIWMALLAGAVCIVIVLAGTRILREYERAVFFRLGRFMGIRGPGIVFIVPGVDRIVKVDLRLFTIDVPPEEAPTSDGATIRVSGVCCARVVDPEAAVMRVPDWVAATSAKARTALRSAVAQHPLNAFASARDALNAAFGRALSEEARAWGVEVTAAELKDVEVLGAASGAVVQSGNPT